MNPSGLVVGGAASSVVSGPKLFTDIAFEAASSGLQLQTQHVYVATAAGAVFQVDYGRWVCRMPVKGLVVAGRPAR